MVALFVLFFFLVLLIFPLNDFLLLLHLGRLLDAPTTRHHALYKNRQLNSSFEGAGGPRSELNKNASADGVL